MRFVIDKNVQWLRKNNLSGSFLYYIVGLSLSPLLSCVPDLSKLKKENPKKTAFMEYREMASKEKRKTYRIYQSWVPFSKISPYLVKAVLIAEDDKFWKHEGFDYEAIQKAIEKDLKAKKFKFGGSTITQQLARNLYLSPEKSLIRKISEAVITWRMEKALSKNESWNSISMSWNGETGYSGWKPLRDIIMENLPLNWLLRKRPAWHPSSRIQGNTIRLEISHM